MYEPEPNEVPAKTDDQDTDDEERDDHPTEPAPPPEPDTGDELEGW
jgi:hypothetical protein